MAAPSTDGRRASARTHWWDRLTGTPAGTGPFGLDSSWRAVHLCPRFDLVVGPGGTFLVTQGIRSRGRVRAEAARVSNWLTSRLGRPVVVHGVLAVPPTDPQPLDQPMDVTIVSERVLGAWLRSHPAVWTELEVAGLARAATGGLSKQV